LPVGWEVSSVVLGGVGCRDFFEIQRHFETQRHREHGDREEIERR
jgi:hypothetical protein